MDCGRSVSPGRSGSCHYRCASYARDAAEATELPLPDRTSSKYALFNLPAFLRWTLHRFIATTAGGQAGAAAAGAQGAGSLWIRALDSLESRLIPGTEGASYP